MKCQEAPVREQLARERGWACLALLRANACLPLATEFRDGPLSNAKNVLSVYCVAWRLYQHEGHVAQHSSVQ